jgi:hypothetical protein
VVLDHTPSTGISITEHSTAKFLRVGPTGGAHRRIKIVWSHCQSNAGAIKAMTMAMFRILIIINSDICLKVPASVHYAGKPRAYFCRALSYG